MMRIRHAASARYAWVGRRFRHSCRRAQGDATGLREGEQFGFAVDAMALVDGPARLVADDDVAALLKAGNHRLDTAALAARHAALRNEALDGALSRLSEIDRIRTVRGLGLRLCLREDAGRIPPNRFPTAAARGLTGSGFRLDRARGRGRL